MAALTKDRLNTHERKTLKREPPVAAATRIWQGSMVALNAAGYAVPALTSTTIKVLGRAEKRADNSGGIAGDIRVPVETGCFQFANSASGDLIAITDIGADCYAVDDQTVAKTSGGGTRSVAGKIFDVDAQGVWVRFS